MNRLYCLVAACLLTLICPAQAGEFKVAGMTFASPKEFISVKPKSFMRKAQLDGLAEMIKYGPRHVHQKRRG